MSLSGIIDALSSIFRTNSREKEHHALVERLYELHESSDQTANNILALMVGMSMELSLGKPSSPLIDPWHSYMYHSTDELD